MVTALLELVDIKEENILSPYSHPKIKDVCEEVLAKIKAYYLHMDMCWSSSSPAPSSYAVRNDTVVLIAGIAKKLGEVAAAERSRAALPPLEAGRRESELDRGRADEIRLLRRLLKMFPKREDAIVEVRQTVKEVEDGTRDTSDPYVSVYDGSPLWLFSLCFLTNSHKEYIGASTDVNSAAIDNSPAEGKAEEASKVDEEIMPSPTIPSSPLDASVSQPSPTPKPKPKSRTLYGRVKRKMSKLFRPQAPPREVAKPSDVGSSTIASM